MAKVELRGIRKSYGRTEILKGIDCAIADGEFLVLLGPSGCGKSTLLRSVAGLESVNQGEIAIDGRVVNGLEPKDRNIAMVFQNYALYPHMTVFDNMAYGLKIANVPRDEIRRRVEEAATILELSPYLERRPRELSGGQRQRVAMGRAIVRKPAVFLFDEPLSNLDAKLRTQMRVEIKKLQHRLGVTSLYVTHDQVEAMTLADRVMVMNKGVAEQIGTPLEVYRRPASLFVAGFIGAPAMNMLPAQTVEGGVVVIDGPRLPLAAPGPMGRSVVLGVRPEALEIAPAATDATLPLRVDLVEALGADTLVHGRLGAAPLIARLPGTVAVREGEALHFTAPTDQLHLFDAESGRRMGD
ncbi:MAG TPA: sn-glycerol-3-phosphate import ATP-binding protein UgpC [Alphaproteobacteria bacterium]|nr:sn-glycerol-3-phosphate import ATP-binding protein UgpC [Alphaproteobacteria bacterium]